MAEWSKAAVLKTAVPATVPGVRIPSPPLAGRKRNAELCRTEEPCLLPSHGRRRPSDRMCRPARGRRHDARVRRRKALSWRLLLARRRHAWLPTHFCRRIAATSTSCCAPWAPSVAFATTERRHLCDTRRQVPDSELCERSGATDADGAVHASGILALGETWTRRLGYGALQSIGKGR